ncbi:MAG: DUF1833 family protein [Bauldia sp.]|nr:DUF1833 family protein [Bauldia sp.]
MARTLSSAFLEAISAEETGKVVVFLVTITHEDLGTPLRFSSDPTQRLLDGDSQELDPVQYGTISRGQTYIFIPMRPVLSDDSEDTPPTARLVIDNVDREMVALLRSTSEQADVKIELVFADSPDTVEVTIPAMNLFNAEYDALEITLLLGIDSMASEPFPAGTFGPGAFPGLHS